MVTKANDTQEFLDTCAILIRKTVLSAVKTAIHLVKSEVRLLYAT